MRLLRSLATGLLHRRTLRALERIETHLATQNTLLTRIADHFAPVYDVSEAPRHSVDHLNPREAVQVLDFVARTERDTGRTPSDEEILQYLADHATAELYGTAQP